MTSCDDVLFSLVRPLSPKLKRRNLRNKVVTSFSLFLAMKLACARYASYTYTLLILSACLYRVKWDFGPWRFAMMWLTVCATYGRVYRWHYRESYTYFQSCATILCFALDWWWQSDNYVHLLRTIKARKVKLENWNCKVLKTYDVM